MPTAAEIVEEAIARAAVVTVEEPDTEADEDAPPKGADWSGHSEKIHVGSLSKHRELIDGGGSCSPGLWLPNDRRLPLGLPCRLRARVLEALQAYATSRGLSLKAILAELLCGKLDKDPFAVEMLENLRSKLKAELRDMFPDMPLSAGGRG